MTEVSSLGPEEVRAEYNRTVQGVQGDYLQFRWLASPTQRRHYAQTRAMISWAAREKQPGRLLEVGCGPAVWTPLLLPGMTQATLLDISDEMLAGAREALKNRENISYVRANFAEADLEGASYDTVASIRAFEYMPDKPRVMAKFAACLRPGGTLILVTKNAGWQDHQQAQAASGKVTNEAAHYLRLQAGVVHWESLASMAREAGLEEVRLHPAVIGTYRAYMRNRAALLAFDLVHRSAYRRPMRPGLNRWTESVLLVARR